MYICTCRADDELSLDVCRGWWCWWWWIWRVERKVSKEWRVLLCRWILVFSFFVFGFFFWVFSLYVLTDNYLVIVIRFLITAHFAAILGAILDRSLYHFLLPIHCAAAMTRLLPWVVVFNQTGYRFIWQLSCYTDPQTKNGICYKIVNYR